MNLKDLVKTACEDKSGMKLATLAQNLRFGHGPRLNGNRVFWTRKDVIDLATRHGGVDHREASQLMTDGEQELEEREKLSA